MKFLIAILIGALLSFAEGCSSGSSPTGSNSSGNTTKNSGTNPTEKMEDVPASVKAAFPNAQSFTKQHKDISAAAIAEIEKDTGAKLPDKDHHSYLAFKTENGARKQIGAATIVKAGGKEIVVVYENKEGSPFINEVRADGVPAPFLAQFKGKGHDDMFRIGADLKAEGVNDAVAKAIAEAIRVDAMTMQSLYGAAHTH